MAELRLSAGALLDLRQIGETGLERHGYAVSAAFVLGFERMFQLLREQPFAGQARPEFRQEVRALAYRPYRILYRIEGDAVVVDRIIHQARDVRLALRGEP